MAARNSNKEKRTPISTSLPPAKADRLQAEADKRYFGVTKLIEDAVDLLFAKIDADAAPAKVGEPPKP